MGVSFKVAKAGKRYRPNLLEIEDKDTENDAQTESQQREPEGDLAEVGDRVANHSSALANSDSHLISEEHEVSFSLNLFPNGFSVGKANELLDDVPKQLHPYDRASESLFCAIEYGCLPGDIFDDLPCKYVDGALLCEIRDYRNILYNKRDSSVEKSPITHKVVLKMCMENVVKDISSISDDSWTYSDLLEAESRILKALQPVLNLNPKQMLDRFCGKAPTKKLNLGIAWSRKKRKLGDTSATDLVFSNAVSGSDIPQVCVAQSSKSQPDLAFQNREVAHFQQTIPTSVSASQENTILQETTSQPFPVLSQSETQLAGSCKPSVSKTRKPSNCISTPKLYQSYCHSDPRKPTTLILGERESCETPVNRGPTIKIPKQEPLDFSQQLLPGIQAETGLASEQQWKKKLFNQRIEAEILLNERTCRKKYPPESISRGQQATLEGIPKLQAGMTNFRVKEEPMEISELPLDAGKIMNNCKMMDMINQSDFQLPRSSPMLRANAPPTTVRLNHINQSVGKNMASEIAQKRKALRISQVYTDFGNASADSCFNDSLAREESMPTGRKSNSLLTDSCTNRIESLASTSKMNASNAIFPAVGMNKVESLATTSHTSVLDAICHLDRTLVCWSSAADDPVNRFSKMKMVTQRYGLDNRKHKLSQVSERRMSFFSNPVAFHLINSENRNLRYGSTDSFHANSMDDKLNICKTRTLTFVRSSHVCQRNGICSSEAQNKLIITEMFDERIVKASAVYGHEAINPIVLPCLQTFPDSHRADLFAAQFTILMSREGFHLVCDQIEHTPLNIEASPIIQQPTVVTRSAIPAAETFELPPPALIPWKSPYILGPTSSTTPAVNPSQLPLQNNFFGGYVNMQSTIQLSLMHQQWQQVHNKLALLQFQRMQREWLQQQLLQRKMMMMGGLGVAMTNLGTVQPGGGTQGLGNIGLGSFNNVMGIRGSSMSMRGSIPGIVNMGEVQTPAANLARRNIGETRVRALMSGFPIQRNEVSYHRMDQLVQTNPQQLSSASVPQQVEAGKVVNEHEYPELS